MGGPWVPDFAGDMKEIKDWLLLTIYGLRDCVCGMEGIRVHWSTIIRESPPDLGEVGRVDHTRVH